MSVTQSFLSSHKDSELWDNVFSEYSKEVAQEIFPALDPNKLSASALCFNMILSIIGTTVLGITAQMRVGGWFATPLLLCLGCAIVSELTFLVSVTIDKLRDQGKQVQAYQDYIEGTLGGRAKILSIVSSALALLGMICNGFILEAKNLEFCKPLDWSWFWQTEHPGRNWWALILSPTTVLYCFVDAGPLLRRIAVMGPVVCTCCILLAWVGTGTAVADLRDFSESCRNTDDNSYWSLWPGGDSASVWDVVLDLTSIAAYSFYCFAVVITVPSLKHEMQEPSKLAPASIVAYISCTILFLSIMLAGYWGFGNLTPENLIDGMRQDRPNGWWGTTRPWETGSGTIAGKIFAWMIIANLLLTDAIYVPCTVVNLVNSAPQFFEGRPYRGFALRLFVIMFRFIVATYVDWFIALTNLTSSLFCVMTNILFPVVAFHAIQAKSVGKVRKALHILIFCFGCLVLVLGTWSALKAIISPSKATTQDPGIFPRQAISADCRRAYELATGL